MVKSLEEFKGAFYVTATEPSRVFWLLEANITNMVMVPGPSPFSVAWIARLTLFLRRGRAFSQ